MYSKTMRSLLSPADERGISHPSKLRSSTILTMMPLPGGDAHHFPGGRDLLGAMGGLPIHYCNPLMSFGGVPTGVLGIPAIGLGMLSRGGFMKSEVPSQHGVSSPCLLSLGSLQNTSRSNQFGACYVSAADYHHFEVQRLVALRQQALSLSLSLSNSFSELSREDSHSMGVSTRKVARPNAVGVATKQRLDDAKVLEALGSFMRKTTSPYIDASDITDLPVTAVSSKLGRGGVTEPFPEKLHRMLREIDEEGDDDIVSFYLHGRAFGIHDQDRFVKEIMPKYFKQTRLSSFQRQLNLYGFTRIGNGPDAGGYFHELFLKRRPTLCSYMRRVGVPRGEEYRRKQKEPGINKEPNFYAMKFIE
jgi:hypothetical protein